MNKAPVEIQKFHAGDIVEVSFLPKSMRHFRHKGKAVVSEVSHNTCQAGTDWEWNYQLAWITKQYPEDTTAWYHNSNLELIAGGPVRRYIL